MNIHSILLAAAAGALGGGVGALISMLLSKDNKARTIVPLVCMLIAYAGTWGIRDRLVMRWDLHEAIATGLASSKANDRFGGYLLRDNADNPKVLAWMVSEQKKGDLQEVRTMSQRLAARGLLTLSDPLILERTRIVGKMLQGLSETDCADLFRGTLRPATMNRALEHLSESDLRGFAKVVSASMAGDLCRLPRHWPDLQLLKPIMDQVFSDATTQQRLQAAAVLKDPKGSPDADVCRLGRRLFDTVAKLPRKQGVSLARLLAGGS